LFCFWFWVQLVSNVVIFVGVLLMPTMCLLKFLNQNIFVLKYFEFVNTSIFSFPFFTNLILFPLLIPTFSFPQHDFSSSFLFSFSFS
jgi:hypothetical protein